MTEIVTIETIGQRGDEIVMRADGPLYVPFALPGERVSIERTGDRARIVEILEPSAERAIPPCRHFGRCGGCALQMLPLEATRRLKHDLVVDALAKRGLAPDVNETFATPPASRRRAVLTARRVGNRLLVGYQARLSHDIIDLEECPVLTPALFGRMPELRAIVAPLVGNKPVRLTVLLTRGGLDINIEGAAAPSPRAISGIAGSAGASGLARLSLDGAPLLTLAEPAVDVAGTLLVPPPGAFLQASAEAEAAMVGLARQHLAGAKHVADLFAGIGTFALALARSASVHAVESNQAALAALSLAARHAPGLKPVTTETRDLFADPISKQELGKLDGVVFDPPRAGAKTQAEALAASKVARVVAVSCNPATFARDIRILVDGGYALERVVPVDQFVYSAETEVVGLLRRA